MLVLACHAVLRSFAAVFIYLLIKTYEEIDGPAVSALRRVIAEVKQHWSVIGRVSMASLRMGDQKIIISSSSVLRKVR
jgi:hypothetical protein